MKLSEFLEQTKHLTPETELIVQDPDTGWLLVPDIFIDEDGITFISQYGDDWIKEERP